MSCPPLQEQLGNIDIYLFDQLLKGCISPGMRILDAGCGAGRNIVYFLREGYETYGADVDTDAIDNVRSLACRLAPRLPAANFRVEPVERMSFADGFADVVLSSAVLHFARDEEQFQAMLWGTWRVLKMGGLLFCRLASDIGIEGQVTGLGRRRFRLPDGSERFLVDEALLTSATEQLGGELTEPLKTTIVHHQRSMTTWVLRKKTRGPLASGVVV